MRGPGPKWVAKHGACLTLALHASVPYVDRQPYRFECRQLLDRSNTWSAFILSEKPEPGQVALRGVDPHDSNSQTGIESCATNSPTMNGPHQADAAQQPALPTRVND